MSIGPGSSSVSTPAPAAVPRVLLAVPRGAASEGGAATHALAAMVSALGAEVQVIEALAEAVDGVELERPRLTVVRLRLGDPTGFGVMQAIDRRWPGTPVLVLSDRPTVAEAVFAMQAGAIWYGGPGIGPELERAVRNALENRPLRGARPGQPCRPAARPNGIVGTSEAMRKMLGQSALVAPTRTTVLLIGETGTGKERLAQALHDASPRRHRPFVAVNCAALAETLLESELFGHEKGAFTGANARREGRFAAADGGTIFLDEMGEISPAMQVKLLRVLQERCFERVGGNQTLSVDVRIIAATNRDLREMVEQRTFRADLFYRLNVMTILVPPLRERREDIPLLVGHFLPRLALELGLPETPVAPAAMQQLQRHNWPGNVRELENTLQRALVLSQGAPINHFDLPDGGGPRPLPAAAGDLPNAPVVPGASFREIERHAIMATYEACGRSPLRTAEVLGLSPRTVHYRLREYRGETGRRRTGRPRELHIVHSGAQRAPSVQRPGRD